MEDILSGLPWWLRPIWPYMGVINASLIFAAVLLMIRIDVKYSKLTDYRKRTIDILNEVKSELMAVNGRLDKLESRANGEQDASTVYPNSPRTP